ncbi:hypothetical protein CCYA_CCYA13G3486 [Cyanidiococcus yangmingshanensis]|nr:hypothetical protein CCYA_CCYA13G3486 [Cyanidiococcus yangmingshanensis]
MERSVTSTDQPYVYDRESTWSQVSGTVIEVEHTVDCHVQPVCFVDLSEEIHGFAQLEKFADNEASVIIMDLEARNTHHAVGLLVRRLEECGKLAGCSGRSVRRQLLGAEPPSLFQLAQQGLNMPNEDAIAGHASGYWTHSIQGPSFIIGYTELASLPRGEEVVAVARLAQPLNAGALNNSLTRFLVLVLTPEHETPHVRRASEMARVFASLFADEAFYDEAVEASNRVEFLAAIRRFLERQQNTALEREAYHRAARLATTATSDDSPSGVVSNDATIRDTIGIMNTHLDKYFKGNGYLNLDMVPRWKYWLALFFRFPGALMIADVRRRLPHYLSDWTAEWNRPRALGKYFFASVFLMFTATLPAIVFGVITNRTTHGQIGVIECLFAQGVLGIGFALFSAQPLMVNMITGPTVVYIQVLYRWSQKLGFAFLPFFGWTGIWMGIFVMSYAFMNTSTLIPYLGRFTDEIFQTFIGIIFMQYWFTEFVRVAHTGYEQVLLLLVLSLGTLLVALLLVSVRGSFLLRPTLRTILGDIGPALSVFIMTGVSYAFDPIDVPRLLVPGPIGYGTTTGRPWIVPLGDLSVGYIFLAMVPGWLLSLIVFIDQQVCTYIVERPENRLRKGTGYSWNLFVTGALAILASILGIPWMYAGLPHSLLHVYALADIEDIELMGKRCIRVIHTREVRIAALSAYLFALLIILAKPALHQLPIYVLYGFILYMGAASFLSNPLWDRFILLFTQPTKYPPTHYVRRVPMSHVHLYTAVQVILTIILFFVAVNFYRGATLFNTGLIFPLVLFLFIPFKWMVLYRWFPRRELRVLENQL